MKHCVALFNDGWADWEAGPVLAALREYLGWSVSIATPMAQDAESIGGVRARANLAFGSVSADSADLVLVIGSDQWTAREHPEVCELLREMAAKAKPFGTICLANVAAARAGVLDSRAHTANKLEDLTTHAPNYRGSAHYRDVRHAVSDQGVVTAAGEAPFTFAAEIIRLVTNGKGEDLASQFIAGARAEFG